MNLPLQVVTHPANIPCVHPTRIINRDLKAADRILRSFEQTISKRGFTPAFQLSHGNRPLSILGDLRLRIGKPWKINQGGASLCGPAALMYCLAKDAPHLYAQYIADLYVEGQAQINNLIVEPSSACRAGKIRIEGSRGGIKRQISAIDWIALASLKDSSNRLLRQRSVSSDAAGITMPGALAAWFTAAGYQHVRESTRLLGSASPEAFMEAAQLNRHNRNVCLFIASKVNKASIAIKPIPNHWVVMCEPLSWFNPYQTVKSPEKDKTASNKNRIPYVYVYHWGEERENINPKKLTLSDFSSYYFGYVVAS